MSSTTLVVAPEVAEALAAGGPVVALESTIISHGLPRPRNLEVARAVEQAVREEGAVPATIGVVGGVARVGLDEEALQLLATSDDVDKASVRDLGTVAALRRDAATTVAATSALAARAGIQVFATGGLGGVHREASATWDESADLVALARTPLVVVCAGVKSILDVPATLERLESLSVPVLGFRSRRFPGFYLSDSGYELDWQVDSAEQVADVVRARRELGIHRETVLVANPLPVNEQVDPALHDAVLQQALSELREGHVTGKAVTPFLLERFHERTGGESLRANIAIILANSRLAARIAVALAS
ncbi:pseudouridine-5'-phosphate glycosidase [Motilibacter rhizosphaerae]|uniref:Pseudouridine-5'-phosphate glycosidase n=1 Tax=Motilibacter rhizosphaerae TaxID=598652 RepID=A0A4Q7NSM1_9ACTN|nr:pseudouridine-5'-phosphate glycosidase [Motilibacter rhizosphaerae]RZS89372.1 pseudouridine-5'-phosphate glycosidase [Motilibacter rhizosphaerae]